MDLHRFSAFDYMKLVVGSALVAAAFQFFTFPNSIVSGGVTGTASARAGSFWRCASWRSSPCSSTRSR